MATLAELFKRGVTQIVALGGTTTSSGDPAGSLVLQEGGLVTAVSGTLKAHPVTLADANPATTVAGLIKGTFKAAWWTPTLNAITTGENVILGFSTDANDETNLGALLTSADSEITTPSGVAVENVLCYGLHDLEAMKALYDGTTTIKTIMVRGVAGVTNADGIIWTIE